MVAGMKLQTLAGLCLIALTACRGNSANTPSTAATNETAVYQTELAHVVQTAMARVPISTPNPTSTTEPSPTAESSPIATMIPGVTVTSKPTPTDTLEPSATPVWSVRLGNDNPKAYIGREMPPYPPDYPKMAGEPKRVQPSRARSEI